MTTNAESILSDVLNQKRDEIAPERTKEAYFELFVSEQALKQFDLSFDELDAGIVDGEHDGGIDSLYTFVSGELVEEELAFNVPKKNPEIELFIIQSKSANGFSENSINKIISSCRSLLSLSLELDDLEQFNESVRGRFNIFRQTYRKLSSKFPTLSIHFVYAAKSASGKVHDNLNIKARELIEVSKDHFGDAHVDFQFWGASELLELARKQPTQTFELRFSVSLNGENGYIALVDLSDFHSFLCAGGDHIRADLFESNVRDYQGSTEVNSEIAATLNDDSENDFWWFNNGVTILASRATSSGSVITVENPQIVNGLQTSSEIGTFFSGRSEPDHRKVMVKVVTSEDEDVRDRIIKATNSQNSVPQASLRATDKVQRDIEHALKKHDLYYDRRKNFYKNEGKPVRKIVSINLLAQAAMTLFRGEPDNARARPSSLIKKDSVYVSLFSEDFPLDAYIVCADTIKRIEVRLKGRGGLSARDRNNLRFYVLYWVVAWVSKSIALSPAKISKALGRISDSDIDDAINEVHTIFLRDGGSDQLAKGPHFKETIKDEVKDRIAAHFAADN